MEPDEEINDGLMCSINSNIMKKFKILFILISMISINCISQECSDFQKLSKCKISIVKSCKIYMQHKNASIGINDTLTYNIVFSGDRDYILTFCTDQKYYPLNIRLLQPETNEEIYDNAKDDYCGSIGVGFYNTQNLIIEVTLLADKSGNDRIKSNEKACVGLDMQWKKIYSSLK
jgi:hypothetical protein